MDGERLGEKLGVLVQEGECVEAGFDWGAGEDDWHCAAFNSLIYSRKRPKPPKPFLLPQPPPKHPPNTIPPFPNIGFHNGNKNINITNIFHRIHINIIIKHTYFLQYI